MCRNPEDCPNKEVCYRHTATWNHYAQSVTFFDWSVSEEGVFECSGFWPVEKRKAK
jgi:hypothetical protein